MILREEDAPTVFIVKLRHRVLGHRCWLFLLTVVGIDFDHATLLIIVLLGRDTVFQIFFVRRRLKRRWPLIDVSERGLSELVVD